MLIRFIDAYMRHQGDELISFYGDVREWKALCTCLLQNGGIFVQFIVGIVGWGKIAD